MTGLVLYVYMKEKYKKLNDYPQLALSYIRFTCYGSRHRFNPLEKELATHSSILAWEIPWTEEPNEYSPWVLKELDTTSTTITTSDLGQEKMYKVKLVCICYLKPKLQYKGEKKK